MYVMNQKGYFLVVIVLLSYVEVSGNEESKLIKKLLRSYSKAGADLSRPVYNSTETLNVRFGLALIKVDMDLETKRLTASVWFRYAWNDVYLKWDPDEYNGISDIRLSAESLWTPDIVLYNGYGKPEVEEDRLAVVALDGSVLWIPPAILRVDCNEADDDEYVCPFKFGSWVYDGFRLDIDFYDDMEMIDVSDYIESDIVKVVGNSAKKNVKYYPCCAEPYPDLTFTLKLKKKNTGWFSWGD